MELISSDLNWETKPHVACLDVLLTGTLTPNQVRLLEEFVAKETGQRFTLIFYVNQIEEIRRVSDEQSSAATK